MSRPRVVVAVHSERGSPGLLDGPLAAAGIERSLWHPYADEPPPRRRDVQGLLVMGGLMNPDEDAAYPFLGPERRLLADALDAGTPVLGVCLGAQLLAQAAGGEAPHLGAMELGWLPVRLLPDAAADPLLAGSGDEVVTYHWHAYGCAPPASAVRLAETDLALQAFRAGPRAWGLQFHPEVDADRVARWAVHGEATLRRAGTSPEEMDAASLRHEPGQIALARRIGEGFAAAVLDAA